MLLKGTCAFTHTINRNKAVIRETGSEQRLIKGETLHVYSNKFKENLCDVTTQSTEKYIISPRLLVRNKRANKNVHFIHYFCPEAPFASVCARQTACNSESKLSAMQFEQLKTFSYLIVLSPKSCEKVLSVVVF